MVCTRSGRQGDGKIGPVVLIVLISTVKLVGASSEKGTESEATTPCGE